MSSAQRAGNRTPQPSIGSDAAAEASARSLSARREAGFSRAGEGGFLDRRPPSLSSRNVAYVRLTRARRSCGVFQAKHALGQKRHRVRTTRGPMTGFALCDPGVDRFAARKRDKSAIQNPFRFYRNGKGSRSRMPVVFAGWSSHLCEQCDRIASTAHVPKRYSFATPNPNGRFRPTAYRPDMRVTGQDNLWPSNMPPRRSCANSGGAPISAPGAALTVRLTPSAN
jgi:hypothetical protein